MGLTKEKITGKSYLGEKSFIIDKKNPEKWSWRKLKIGIPVKTGKIPCLVIKLLL